MSRLGTQWQLQGQQQNGRLGVCTRRPCDKQGALHHDGRTTIWWMSWGATVPCDVPLETLLQIGTCLC